MRAKKKEHQCNIRTVNIDNIIENSENSYGSQRVENQKNLQSHR